MLVCVCVWGGAQTDCVLLMCDSHPNLIKSCCCCCVQPLHPALPSLSVSDCPPAASALVSAAAEGTTEHYSALLGEGPSLTSAVFSLYIFFSFFSPHALTDENVPRRRVSLQRVRFLLHVIRDVPCDHMTGKWVCVLTVMLRRMDKLTHLVVLYHSSLPLNILNKVEQMWAAFCAAESTKLMLRHSCKPVVYVCVWRGRWVSRTCTVMVLCVHLADNDQHCATCSTEKLKELLSWNFIELLGQCVVCTSWVTPHFVDCQDYFFFLIRAHFSLHGKDSWAGAAGQ